MKEFRARLRFKRVLWLGLTVIAVEAKLSKASKLPYYLISFLEIPFKTAWYWKLPIGAKVNAEISCVLFQDKYYQRISIK